VTARGVATAARLADPGPRPRCGPRRHCSDEEWRRWVHERGGNRQNQLQKLRFRRQFVERWPTLGSWFAAPLPERVGRLRGESFHRPSNPVSFRARGYLIYLGLRGHTTFDYPWLFAPGQLSVVEPAAAMGLERPVGGQGQGGRARGLPGARPADDGVGGGDRGERDGQAQEDGEQGEAGEQPSAAGGAPRADEAWGGTLVGSERTWAPVRVFSAVTPGGPPTSQWGNVDRIVYDHPTEGYDLTVDEVSRGGTVRLPTLASEEYSGREYLG